MVGNFYSIVKLVPVGHLELKHNINFSLIRRCSRYAYAKKETINLTKDFLTPTAGGDWDDELRNSSWLYSIRFWSGVHTYRAFHLWWLWVCRIQQSTFQASLSPFSWPHRILFVMTPFHLHWLYSWSSVHDNNKKIGIKWVLLQDWLYCFQLHKVTGSPFNSSATSKY